jgi:hypothetical protein
MYFYSGIFVINSWTVDDLVFSTIKILSKKKVDSKWATTTPFE